MRTRFSKFHSDGTCAREGGFSVIELVGVLTIIAIIAGAAAPAFIKRTDHDAWTTERAAVKKLAEGLVAACVKHHHIPTAANWPAAIASNLNVSASQAAVNGRQFTRVFVSDPALDIGGAGLPYVQGTVGPATAPVNARGLILSTIAVPLPSLAGISSADFNDIWTTAEGTKPTALSGWTGKAEDLIVERVEFRPLFHKLVLVNVDPLPDAVPNRGHFSINMNATAYISPDATPVSVARYYMEGTVVSFFHANGTGFDSAEILKGDRSFVYRKARWGRRLGGSDDVIGNFGELITEFMEGPPPAEPKFAATQQAVINELYSFLWAYAVWAIGDPSTVYTASGATKTPAVPQFAADTPNFPAFLRATEAQVHMSDFTDNLIH